METTDYFQIWGYRYVDNPFEMGTIGGVAFKFSVIPVGNDALTFEIKVIFSLQLLAAIGRQFVRGGAFLLDKDKPRFLRYAFHCLKAQLETTNLENREDIVVGYKEAKLFSDGLPKQCDFLVSHGKSLYCVADADNPIETSTQLCETCALPEPLFRCDNLRVQRMTGSADSDNKWKITPNCYCISGNVLQSDLERCNGFPEVTLNCWVPFKFCLQPPPKPRIGFKT